MRAQDIARRPSMPSYVPPYAALKQRFAMSSAKDRLVASIDYEELQRVIQLLLRGVSVDEAWYRRTYPDVAEAIEAGTVGSAKAHFIDNGYFEGRLPFPLEVDEDWYRANYTDIGQAIAQGEFASATTHFVEYGYTEGRLPGAAG
jgi:hypothetical protein